VRVARKFIFSGFVIVLFVLVWANYSAPCISTLLSEQNFVLYELNEISPLEKENLEKTLSESPNIQAFSIGEESTDLAVVFESDKINKSIIQSEVEFILNQELTEKHFQENAISCLVPSISRNWIQEFKDFCCFRSVKKRK
jgi:hypothetical protein